MIQGAIFDMDGVLVDNTAYHIRAFDIFCARYGVTDWQKKLEGAFGMGNDDIMNLLMPADVVQAKGVPALAEEKEAIYREIFAPDIHPVAGLVELLDRLNKAGIRCAVGSSAYRPNVEFVLDACNLRPYFAAQVNGDMVSHCKPDPEIYLMAAAKLGLDPANCVVFEDAKAGITAAHRAGIGCVVALVTTLPREVLAGTEANRIIGDFRELTEEKAFNEFIKG